MRTRRGNRRKPPVCSSNTNNVMLNVPNIDLSKFLNCRVEIPSKDQLPVSIILNPNFKNCRVEIPFKDQLPAFIALTSKFPNCRVDITFKDQLPVLFTADPKFQSCRVNIDFKDQLPVLITLNPALKEKYEEPDSSKMRESRNLRRLLKGHPKPKICKLSCCDDPKSKINGRKLPGPGNLKRTDPEAPKGPDPKCLLRPRRVRNYAESSLDDSASEQKNNVARIPVYLTQQLNNRKVQTRAGGKNGNDDVYEFDSDSESRKKKKTNRKKLNESSAYDEDIKKAMSKIRRKEKKDCDGNVNIVVADFKKRVNNKKIQLELESKNQQQKENKRKPPIIITKQRNNNTTIISSSGDDTIVSMDLSVNNNLKTGNNSIAHKSLQSLGLDVDLRNINDTDAIYKTPPDKIKEPDFVENNDDATDSISFDDDSFTELPVENEPEPDDWGAFSDNLPIANSTMIQKESHPWRLSMENAVHNPYLLKIKQNALPDLLQDSILDATFEEKISRHHRKPQVSASSTKSPVKKSPVQRSIRDYLACKRDLGEKENAPPPRLSMFDGGDLSPVGKIASDRKNRIESVRRNILGAKNNNVIIHSVVELRPSQTSGSSTSGNGRSFAGFSPEVVGNSRDIANKISTCYQDLCSSVDNFTGSGVGVGVGVGDGESKSKSKSCFGFNSVDNSTAPGDKDKDQPKPSRISLNTIKTVIRNRTRTNTAAAQSLTPIENVEEFEAPTPVAETSETVNIFDDLKPILPSKTYNNSKYKRKRLLSGSECAGAGGGAGGFEPIEDRPATVVQKRRRKRLQSVESEGKREPYHKKKKDLLTADEDKEFEEWVQKMNAEFQEIEQSVLEVDG